MVGFGKGWVVGLYAMLLAPIGCGDDGGDDIADGSGTDDPTGAAGDEGHEDGDGGGSAGPSAGDDDDDESGGVSMLEARDDAYEAASDRMLIVDAAAGVLSNDDDAPLVLEADLVSEAGAQVSVGDDGSFTYVPPADFRGTDHFSYTAEGSQGDTAAADVAVEVFPVPVPLPEVPQLGVGFALRGENPEDDAGAALSIVGDVNGDGIADILVGARYADANGSLSGRAYLVFGGPDLGDLDLGALGDAGFVIEAAAEDHRVGSCVAGVGDLDGDGLDDLAVCAPRAHIGLDGILYVIFGKADTSPVDLGALGDGGYEIIGQLSSDEVNAAGDVNGDGLEDLVVGMPFEGPAGSFSGRGLVVFGKSDTAPIELDDLGDHGFSIDGAAEDDHAGRSIDGAGDVNGDGLDDVIIGAPVEYQHDGRAFVVFGKPDASAVQLSALGDGGFEIVAGPEDLSAGIEVSGAGDVNGDGLADVLVGAPRDMVNHTGDGRAHVVFGKDDGATVVLGGGDGTFAIDGGSWAELFGYVVSEAGDMDGDGLDDLLIAAPTEDAQGPNAGAVYVIYGKADTATISIASLGDGGYPLIDAFDYGNAGCALSGGGDVDGDGRPDVLVGVPGQLGQPQPGDAYGVTWHPPR